MLDNRVDRYHLYTPESLGVAGVLLRVLYSDDFRLHDSSPYSHPERPERLDHARHGLGRLGVHSWVEPPLGDYWDYLEVHERGYLERIRELASSGTVEWLDPDTYVSPGTIRAVERLSGAARLAVEAALEGRGPVLILGRPPGHHAGRSGLGLGAPTQGFCIVNTSALLAARLSRHGRVAVLDFDAHHGNGTQDILWAAEVLHVDIHQDSATLYPGTGFPWQKGASRTPKVNINVPPGSGDDIYRVAVDIAVHVLREYDPDYLVVSAGFDAYKGDTPFTSLRASTRTFHRIGLELKGWAGRTVVMLEGGYSIGLERGLPAFLAGLQGLRDPVGDAPTRSSGGAMERFMLRVRQLEEALGTRLPVRDDKSALGAPLD